MATIADYLVKLDELRDELARGLVTLGVPAEETETLQSLVPKLLKIPVGDTSKEFAELAWLVEKYPCTFEFLNYEETVAFNVGVMAVTGLNRIGRAELALEGSNVDLLDIIAPGWTVERETGRVLLSRTFPTLTSRFELQAWIEAIVLSSRSNDVKGVATLSVFGADTQAEYHAAGAMAFQFLRNSWAATDARGYTWADIEASRYTWDEMENLGKPSNGG